MKTNKTLSWKPVRRGKIYCSSACGANCTHADHLKAHQEAKDTIAKLKTKGWKARVWENMGWHWCLVNTTCGISLHKSFGKFWTLMGSEKGSSHGDCGINYSSHHANPNRAVKEQIELALTYYQHMATAYENLLRFKQSVVVKTKTKKPKLTPPDKERCQAEKPNGNSFMTLGGIPERIRCEAKPVWIAYENKPGPDGLKGSMSLCASCATVARRQLGKDFFTLKRI